MNLIENSSLNLIKLPSVVVVYSFSYTLNEVCDLFRIISG